MFEGTFKICLYSQRVNLFILIFIIENILSHIKGSTSNSASCALNEITQTDTLMFFQWRISLRSLSGRSTDPYNISPKSESKIPCCSFLMNRIFFLHHFTKIHGETSLIFSFLLVAFQIMFEFELEIMCHT